MLLSARADSAVLRVCEQVPGMISSQCRQCDWQAATYRDVALYKTLKYRTILDIGAMGAPDKIGAWV